MVYISYYHKKTGLSMRRAAHKEKIFEWRRPGNKSNMNMAAKQW